MDPRNQLADIIKREFKTRREFCKKVGLDEAFLSSVLSRKKNFSIDNLSAILGKIGYEMVVVKKKIYSVDDLSDALDKIGYEMTIVKKAP